MTWLLESAQRFTAPDRLWLLLLLPVLLFLYFRFYQKRNPALLISGLPGKSKNQQSRWFSFSPPGILLAWRLGTFLFLGLVLANLVE